MLVFLGTIFLALAFAWFNLCCDTAVEMCDVNVNRLFRIINYLILVLLIFINR